MSSQDVVTRLKDSRGNVVVEVLMCGHSIAGESLKVLKPGKLTRLCRACREKPEQPPKRAMRLKELIQKIRAGSSLP